MPALCRCSNFTSRSERSGPPSCAAWSPNALLLTGEQPQRLIHRAAESGRPVRSCRRFVGDRMWMHRPLPGGHARGTPEVGAFGPDSLRRPSSGRSTGRVEAISRPPCFDLFVFAEGVAARGAVPRWSESSVTVDLHPDPPCLAVDNPDLLGGPDASRACTRCMSSGACASGSQGPRSAFQAPHWSDQWGKMLLRRARPSAHPEVSEAKPPTPSCDLGSVAYRASRPAESVLPLPGPSFRSVGARSISKLMLHRRYCERRWPARWLR